MDLFKVRYLFVYTAAVLLLPLLTFGQKSKYLSIYTNYATKRVENSLNWSKILSDVVDSTLYFTTKNNDSQNRLLYSTNKEFDTLYFNTTGEAQSFSTELLFSFTALSDCFVFVGSQYVYIFNSQDENGELILRHKLKNEFGLLESYKIDDQTVFLRVFFDYHPLDESDKHLWAKLDVKSGNIHSVSKMSDDDVAFSHFVNDLVDVHNQKILRSESTKYLLRVYDENFNLVDSLYSSELDSLNDVDMSFVKTTSFFSKTKIGELKKFDDSLLTRIRKAYFLNDTTVMVLIKLKQRDVVRADIWVKYSNGWKRTIQDSSSIWFEMGESYSKDKTIYADFYQNVSDLVYLGDNTFHRFYFPYISNIETENYDSKEDYFYKQRDAFKNEKAHVGGKVLKLNFDFD